MTEVIENAEPEETPPDEPQTNDQLREAKAREHGWVSEDEWIEAGRDPVDWCNHEAFNVRAPLLRKLKSQEKEHANKFDTELNTRLDAITKVHKAQLMVERNKAIELGGTEGVAEVAAIDRQMEELNVPVQPANNPHQALNNASNEWESKNPWIFEESVKANHARAVFAQGVQQGLPPETVIARVDREIAKAFPARTTEPAPLGENSKPAGFNKRSKAELTMADLTAEEKQLRTITPTAWKTDKEFLKAVKDVREAEEKQK